MATPINKILTNHKQTLSVDELANVSASLSAILGQGGGGGGEPCASAWLPSVSDAGVISWTLTTATSEPATANIKGPSGDRGPAGTSGAKGDDGTSVIVKSIREFNDTVGSHTKGGTEVTLEWTEDDVVKTSAFSAFNGEKGQDGAGASYTFDTGNTLSGDGSITPIGVNTTHAFNFANASAYSATYAEQFTTSEGGTEDIARLWDVILDLDDTVTSLGYEGQVEHKGIIIESDGEYYPSAIGLTDSAYNAVKYVTAYSGKLLQAPSGTSTQTIYGYQADNAHTHDKWVDLTTAFVDSVGFYNRLADDTVLPTHGISAEWDGNNLGWKIGLSAEYERAITSVSSNYLPLSGGTVSGKTTISASDFDHSLEFIRPGANTSASTGQVGINGAGGLSFKINRGDNINTQLNVAATGSLDKRFSIGVNPYDPSAYFIPALTSTAATGLTDDGILHIIVEN